MGKPIAGRLWVHMSCHTPHGAVRQHGMLVPRPPRAPGCALRAPSRLQTFLSARPFGYQHVPGPTLLGGPASAQRSLPPTKGSLTTMSATRVGPVGPAPRRRLKPLAAPCALPLAYQQWLRGPLRLAAPRGIDSATARSPPAWPRRLRVPAKAFGPTPLRALGQIRAHPL